MIDVLASSPVAQVVGFALVQFVWQGAAIAAVTALALRMLRGRSPNARYAAACVGLTAMLAAPAITAWSTTPNVASAAPRATTAALQTAAVGVTPAFGPMTPADRPVAPRSAAWLRAAIEPRLPFIFALWAIGVLALTLQLAGNWVLIERLRRAATRVSDDAMTRCVGGVIEALHVRRRVQLAQSALVAVPTVVGWLRPMVLLPASALAGLSPAQLQAILAHEIAHVRRHDYLVNLLQSLVETLLFYHPGVWWVSRQIRLEREYCCDDLAADLLGSRVAYASALASLEELRGTPIPALAATGGDLVTRIRRLLGRPHGAAPQSTWMVITLGIATVSIALAGGRMTAAATSPLTTPGPMLADRPEAALTPAAPRSAQTSASRGPVGVSTAPRAQAPGARGTSAPPPQVEMRPAPPPAGAPAKSTDQLQVADVEDQLRSAVVRNDVGALTGLLADEYLGTSQNGATRNKTQALQTWATARVSSVNATLSGVQVAKGLAIVTGSMIEVNETGTDRMLFTRVWRKDDSGWWKLVSSSQFRDPRVSSTAGTPPPAPPQPGAVPGAQAPLRVGGDIKEPKKIADVKPIYPEEARAARMQGIVILEILINEQGGVGDARVLRSIPMLDQPALDAVKQWRFTPTLLNGVPVSVLMTVTVNFTLP